MSGEQIGLIETVKLLTDAGQFVGGLLVVFGAFWLFLNFNQQTRLTGPIIVMIAGATIASLAVTLGGDASFTS